MGLWFQPQFVMLCSWKGNQKLDHLSLGWANLCGAFSTDNREGKKLASTVTPGLWSFSLRKGCWTHWMIDLSFGCISVAIIQRDEGGPEHTWPLAGGTHSIFPCLSFQPTFSSQKLSSEVRSGFKVSSTDSSTCLNLRLVWGMLSLLHLVFSLHSY